MLTRQVVQRSQLIAGDAGVELALLEDVDLRAPGELDVIGGPGEDPLLARYQRGRESSPSKEPVHQGGRWDPG